MMSLWDALRMNMMISYQELVRTFLNLIAIDGVFHTCTFCCDIYIFHQDTPLG